MKSRILSDARVATTIVSLLSFLIAACERPPQDDPAARAATAEEAVKFVAQVEANELNFAEESNRIQWVNANFITDDTQWLLAQDSAKAQARGLQLARQSARFDGLELDYDTQRKLRFLRQDFVLPPPSSEPLNAELARLRTELPGEYSSFKYCRSEGDCLTFDDMNLIMGNSRNPEELKEIWTEWRKVSYGFTQRYARIVELGNQGSREMGYADIGAVWRLGYDMPAEEFSAELDRLIGQMRPLYEALHCHVRAKLNQAYGDAVVPATGPIPAHVLGNMWAQTWENIYPLMGLEQSQSTFNLTKIIADRGMSEKDMTRTAEAFFVSLGMDPLPETFWKYSLFTRPQDREVDCYASAWHIDAQQDVRLKMCIQRNEEDFNVLHHELGHNYYQLAYSGQDFLYRNSANDGFHEAVGDTLGLSVTPVYLEKLGFIDKAPETNDDVPALLKSALEKVALLPWTYLVDQWRWRVFSGEIKPEDYNKAWWELRLKYQGLVPPTDRPGEAFDAAAKYHVTTFVPYTRYFLAQVLQFQFHRSLCQAAGYDGPLNRCSIYGSEEAGKRLSAMMAMGRSRPWQEALEALTGAREMDATAILDYYAPLQAWLNEQNEGRTCGW